MASEYMEMAAAVAFGVLTAIFVSALVILVVICKRQRFFRDMFGEGGEMSRPEKKLIEPDKPEMELGEVGEVHSNIDGILANEQWVDDATGLIPHCLSVLKTCRCLTERLTGLAMNSVPLSGNFAQFVESARRISFRVDEMVKSMYPPLDPKLLEARATALLLAVTHLILIAKYECGKTDRTEFYWIDRALSDMEGHISVLRQAAALEERQNGVLYLNAVM